MQIIVIIPTYNEIENIEKIIEDIFLMDLAIDILVVDDNSPDKTYKKVEKLQKRYKNRLFLLKRDSKDGLGKAYIDGFKFALKSDKNYNYFIEMDADFSHNPIYLTYMIENIKNFDLIIGSRYVKGGKIENWSYLRKIISFGGNFYAKWILKMGINDLTSGFKCFRREVLEEIDLNGISSLGYMFQIEMNYIIFKKGFKIKEIPIVFTERRFGKSKMSKKIFFEAFWKVLFLRFKGKNDF